MMKTKHLLFCIALSISLVLSGCGENEIPQEDTIYQQDNAKEEENTYFLSTDSDFYEKALSNPVDQNYVIDRDAPALGIWQAALEKCEAWNQQMDFTCSKLESLLSKADYDKLQDAIGIWHEYYQEEVFQNRELYGNTGIIFGSMYTAASADVLMEKCKVMAFILLSQEYELSGKLSFAENTAAADTDEDKEYAVSSENFCIEYDSDFKETLDSYSIDEKNSDELEELIRETANQIEERFGHDFTEHANQYISFIQALYSIENDISEDNKVCLIVKENRLRLYAAELLNIAYVIENQ